MADETRDPSGDPELSRRYRDLPRDEPGEALDAAILAAARRAAETRPAPLVPPTARRRWYFPLAAAAVLVLAVAVTVQMERNQPDVDGLTLPASTAPAAPQAPLPAPPAKERKQNGARLREEPPAKREAFSKAVPRAEQAPSAAASDVAGRRDMASEPKSGAGTNALSAAPPEAAAMRPQAQPRALAKVQSPDQMLERIAALRREGRDEEADKALAEFRSRYPDFKISEEMRKKVERR